MQNNAAPIICPKCKAAVSNQETFCRKCGAFLGETTTSSQHVSSLPTASIQPIPPPGGSVPSGSHNGSNPGLTTATTIPVYPPLHNRRRRFLVGFVIILLVVVLIFVLIFRAVTPPGKIVVTPGATPSVIANVPDGLDEFLAPDKEMIGVNDGSFAPFDTWHDKQELSLKQQAAQALHNGERSKAESLWKAALDIDSSDAEALIYTEDQRILEGGNKPYLTIVVCVDFVNISDPSAQRQLQGVYVAQREHNIPSASFNLRVLIADSGREVSYASLIAQQIAQIAKKDTTIVGVIGWLTSSRSHQALPILANAKIPQISSQASDDALSGSSPYFFRVVPPNHVQAVAAAQFAQQTLGVKNPVIFYDPGDNYSQNLVKDFEQEFAKSGRSGLQREAFITDKTKDFASLIHDALQYNPDAFYFISASKGDTGLFQDALPVDGPFAHLPVISGDAGYVAHPKSYNRWFFTAFAFPDEWSLVVGKDFPPFFQEYSDDFDATGQKPAGYYGYSRPDDSAILAYDATSVLLKGVQIAITSGKARPAAQDVASFLPQITGDQAVQGVSGQISFDTNHDPANKAIVFLYTSADGHLHEKSVQGCFIKGCP